ncbi:glutamate biosynthesis transcriptional regulator GltC [Staphylococcus durrellii]|uniref:glutamate biosynthesis transcriptional regulator GltC n=1 Tax=Staphylococcus durrellii TaxID=2781773 RepID=UPI00189E4DC5|nr:LysR family transcriptional regulator [Staphylococcus durrellii]MBF7017934.1 LysR family transcriptional regulator [Staphylococcus durrellii]
MEIKQLRYFIEVAKREHISEAALELDIAQSAISRQITQLEEELQITLFKRQGRNIYLTEAGQTLFTEATKILEQAESTIRLFHNQSELNNFTIRLGYVDSYISQVLALLIQTFENTSESKIEPMLMEETEIATALISNQIDVALMDLTSEVNHNNDVEVIPLFEENYHMYVPKDNPIAMATNPPLSQFVNTQIYQLYKMPSNIIQTFEQQTKKPVRTITHKQIAKYILTQNRGYIIAPAYQTLDKNDQHWIEISLEHTELKRTLCCAIRKDNHKNDIKELKSTIDHLLSRTSTYH